MSMIKRYLENVVCRCSDEAFGQEAVEHAIFSGRVKLTYKLEVDVEQIMGVRPPTLVVGMAVMVGTFPMNREGKLAAPGPRGGWFVQTNLGEVFYESRDIALDLGKGHTLYDTLIEEYQAVVQSNEAALFASHQPIRDYIAFQREAA